jgi:hypothetical protein
MDAHPHENHLLDSSPVGSALFLQRLTARLSLQKPNPVRKDYSSGIGPRLRCVPPLIHRCEEIKRRLESERMSLNLFLRLPHLDSAG